MASSEAAMTGRTGQLIAGAKTMARAAAGPQGAAGANNKMGNNEHISFCLVNCINILLQSIVFNF